MKFSFIVPCFNSSQTIQQCLKTIQSQIDSDLVELIIVDNNSQDNTLEMINNLNINVKLLKCLDQGAAFARNLGAKEAKGEFLVFIDSDVTLNSDWLDGLKQSINGYPWAHCFSAAVMPVSKNKKLLQRYRLKKHKIQTLQTGSHCIDLENRRPLINSSLFAIKAEVFQQLEGFNTHFDRNEDFEFTSRLISSHFHIHSYLNISKVYFDGGLISYLTRNYKTGKFMLSSLSYSYIKFLLKNCIKYLFYSPLRLLEILLLVLGQLKAPEFIKNYKLQAVSNNKNRFLRFKAENQFFYLSPAVAIISLPYMFYFYRNGELIFFIQDDKQMSFLNFFKGNQYSESHKEIIDSLIENQILIPTS